MIICLLVVCTYVFVAHAHFVIMCLQEGGWTATRWSVGVTSNLLAPVEKGAEVTVIESYDTGWKAGFSWCAVDEGGAMKQGFIPSRFLVAAVPLADAAIDALFGD